MQTDRPVNLSLFKHFSWPLAALVSISHRITGAILFVGVGFGLYALDMALSSAAGFDAAAAMLAEPIPKLMMLALLFVLTFHLVAGVKHLLLDVHIGDSLQGVKAGSIVVIVVSLAVTGALGGLLW
jgi:succinate dehydrogenase / fumarate reductase cytochrome b subunit